jgi:hypothetical protein
MIATSYVVILIMIPLKSDRLIGTPHMCRAFGPFCRASFVPTATELLDAAIMHACRAFHSKMASLLMVTTVSGYHGTSSC